MYKIFLADDEMWVVLGLKKLIEKTGLPFRVIGEANDGVTTLEEVKKRKPDILITDIRMPGLDGLELTERLNAGQLPVKVVFISGYAEFEYARKAVSMGAADYLLKPVEQEGLEQVLQRLQKQLDKERGTAGDQEEEPASPTMVEQIIREIQEHYMENITLSGLSTAYGISTGYLSRLIKDKLGLTFTEYIAAKRIQLAKELLADENLSIDYIAGAVGYEDYFYFTKVFKKTAGISPSKYRKTL